MLQEHQYLMPPLIGEIALGKSTFFVFAAVLCPTDPCTPPVQTSKLKHYIPSRELIYPTSKKKEDQNIIFTSATRCGIFFIVPWRGTKNLHPLGYTVKRLLRFDVEFVVVTVVEFRVKICCSIRCCVSLICCNCFVSLAFLGA